jgi:hypothetical protein
MPHHKPLISPRPQSSSPGQWLKEIFWLHYRLIIPLALSTLFTSCGPGTLGSTPPSGLPSQSGLWASIPFRLIARDPSRNEPSVHRLRQAWINKAKCGSSVIYSSDDSTNTIDLFPQSSSDEGPCGQLTLKRPPLRLPQGLFVDKKGDLWVANSLEREIVEFAPLSNKVLKTLYDTVGEPGSVVVDPNKGSVYVANLVGDKGGLGGVVAFDNGSKTPTRQLSDATLEQAFFVTIDTSGNVYATGVAAHFGAVHEWLGGKGKGVDLGIQLQFPGGIETTNSGALLICDQRLPACGDVEPGTTALTNEFATSSADPVNASLDAAEDTALTEDAFFLIIYAWQYPGPDSNPLYDKTIGIPSSIFVATYPAPPIGKPFTPSKEKRRRGTYASR